jgi:dihydrofolate reductase
VLADISGDTVMPDPRQASEWKETEVSVHAPENGRPGFRFVTLDRA